MIDDEDIVLILAVLARARPKFTVHIRGTEQRLVVEFKDKRTRRVIGLKEVKERLK